MLPVKIISLTFYCAFCLSSRKLGSMVMEYRFRSIVLLAPVVISMVGCNPQRHEGQTADTAAMDTTITCVSHGIPSRAAAIAESEKEHTFLGADDVIMIYIQGGTFSMGTAEFADASPIHEVTVSGFWMDEH